MTDHSAPRDAAEVADQMQEQALRPPPPGTGGTSDDDDQPADAESTGTLGEHDVDETSGGSA